MDCFFLMYMTISSMFLSVHLIGVNCPYEVCECYENTIDCRDHELTEVPTLLTTNLTMPMFLDLNNNQLTTIPPGVLPPNVFSIDFQQNPIRTIDDDGFGAVAYSLIDLSFSQALFTDLPMALLQLNNLQHLTIADMPIYNWDIDTVKHIGLTLQTLILINTSLTSWPTWITYMPHLGTLELSYMTFQFPEDALDNQVDTLFSVNFEKLNLTEIPKAISKLKHLQDLVLDDNNITNVTALPNSPNLTMLSLDRNKISDAGQLSEGLRPAANSLTTLQLRENRLQAIPDLSALVKLQSIFLTQNVISSIGSGKVPPSLSYIDVENNFLPSLYLFMQPGIFLSILRFDHNSVLNIRGIDIPVSATDMSIMYNRITELTDTSFPVSSQMEELSLDFNPISKISLSAFVNLNKLFFMSLASTQLTRLPLGLSALTHLSSINLGQISHLVCTCVEKGLREWSYKVEITGDCGVTSIQYFLQFMSDQCPD